MESTLPKLMKLGILILASENWKEKFITNKIWFCVFYVYYILVSKYSPNTIRQANPFRGVACWFVYLGLNVFFSLNPAKSWVFYVLNTEQRLMTRECLKRPSVRRFRLSEVEAEKLGEKIWEIVKEWLTNRLSCDTVTTSSATASRHWLIATRKRGCSNRSFTFHFQETLSSSNG